MQMKPVKSSNVESVGYDSETKTLGVKFKNNPKVYEYPGVPADTHAALMAAESVGSYFARNIKGKFAAPEGTVA